MATEITHRDRATELGVVRINNDAIATIASIAAMEIRGVHKMGGGIGRTLYEMFVKKSNIRGVRVHISDGESKLTVFIVVEYGVDIPRIADEVQENVKRAIEKMAGLALSEVDVVVEGVFSPTTSDNKKCPKT